MFYKLKTKEINSRINTIKNIQVCKHSGIVAASIKYPLQIEHVMNTFISS